MKRFLAVLAALMVFLTSGCAMAARSYSDIRNSVVRFYVEYPIGRQVEQFSADKLLFVPSQSPGYIGSGYAVGMKGEPVKYIVTNEHVVSNEVSVTAYLIDAAAYEQDQINILGEIALDLSITPEIYVILDDMSTSIRANLEGYSDRADLAVVSLSVPTDKRVPATLRPFTELKEEEIYIAGFPGVADVYVDRSSAGDNLLSTPDMVNLTNGIVSRVLSHGVTQAGEQVAHSAPTSGGNSGGPLVDVNGNVLGTHAMGLSGSGTQGFNCAISVNEVIRMLDNYRIPYMTVKEASNTWMIGAAAALVIIVAAVALALFMGQKNRKTSIMLVGINGALRGKAYRLKAVTIVGRAAGCNVLYPDNAAGVSGKHCTLQVKNNMVYVTDTSSHGTWIDKTKLTPHVPTVLKQGQILSLGSSKEGLTLK